jgi:hypothetical protein
MVLNTRREFLAEVGRGMLLAGLGTALASDLAVAPAWANDDAHSSLQFGPLEPLAALMQETPPALLTSKLVDRLKTGTDLRTLTAAGALANARTFGGEDYVGFHTMMALAPAFHMSEELPTAMQPLPVFKVLYRNTNRIQEHGGRKGEVLHAVKPASLSSGELGSKALQDAIRSKNVQVSEEIFCAIAKTSADNAFNYLLFSVQDNTEVHRVVLPYRAWDLLGLIGRSTRYVPISTTCSSVSARNA